MNAALDQPQSSANYPVEAPSMNRRFRSLFTVTFLLTAIAIASTGTALAERSTATAAEPVTIPFELVTRHIVVKVRINNSRPLSFVFDTGDKLGIVDTEVAKELGLRLEGQLRVGGAGNDTLPGSFVKEATWTLTGLGGFSQPITMSIPLGRMAARFGHDFDGIIGADFIRQFVVEVDYQNRVLKLHDKDKFAYTGKGESIPIEITPYGHPYLEAEITPISGNPIKGKFVLDLGSGGSLVLMSPVVSEHNLIGDGTKTYRAIGVGGAGGQSTGQIGRVRELRLGSYKIADPFAMFSQDKAGAMASHALIGNIGQQVASKFRVYLDYSHDRIILEPNATFAEKMDRAIAGLALTTAGKDHETISIAEVLENSPAAEAGLQKDDVIVDVDERSGNELTITRILEMFEQPRQRKLTVKRGEQTLNLTLTPRKLI